MIQITIDPATLDVKQRARVFDFLRMYLGGGPTAPCTAVAETQPSAPEVSISTPTANVQLPSVSDASDTVAHTEPVNMGNPALDAEGVPWDPRIHSEGRSKISDGTWKLKRGVDKAIVDQVKAELLGVNAAFNVVAEVAPTPTPTPTTGAEISDYVALVGRTSAKIQSGAITLQQVNDILIKHGLAALPLLSTRLDLVPQVAAEIDAL